MKQNVNSFFSNGMEFIIKKSCYSEKTSSSNGSLMNSMYYSKEY